MTALLPPGVKVHLALGFIDMRKGIDGLAMLVQGVLQATRNEANFIWSPLYLRPMLDPASGR
jgi:hypothetical protein